MSQVGTRIVGRDRFGKFLVPSLAVVAVAILCIVGVRALIYPVPTPQKTSGDFEASKTPLLDEAVEFIRSESEWIYSRNSEALPREYWFAISAMNYAPTRMRAVKHNRLKRTNADLPGSTEECLEQGAGICGHHIEFFLYCMEQFDIPARPVEFYKRIEADNHIVAEVFYDGQWRMIDVTWGTVYRGPDASVADLLSVEQLLQMDNPLELAVANDSDLWYQYVVHSQLDPLRYLTWQAKDVITNGIGTVHLFPKESPSESIVRYVAMHRPTFIGSNLVRDPENRGGIECSLDYSGSGISTMKLDITGLAGEGALLVQSGLSRVSVPFGQLHVGPNDIDLATLEISEKIVLSVDATSVNGIAYIAHRAIELHR